MEFVRLKNRVMFSDARECCSNTRLQEEESRTVSDTIIKVHMYVLHTICQLHTVVATSLVCKRTIYSVASSAGN